MAQQQQSNMVKPQKVGAPQKAMSQRDSYGNAMKSAYKATGKNGTAYGTPMKEAKPMTKKQHLKSLDIEVRIYRKGQISQL